MPNWKKLITSGSSASLFSLNVTGSGFSGAGAISGSNLYFPDYSGSISFDEKLNFFNRYNGSNVIHINRGNMHFEDNGQLKFGDSGDFSLSHEPNNSYISNNTGDLHIQNHANDKDIILRSDDGAGNTTKYLTIDGSEVEVHIHRPLVVTGSIDVTENITVAGKVGAATNDEYFDFGTDAMIKVAIDNVEDFRFSDGGTFHANADIVAFSTTVASDEKLKTNIAETKYGLDHILRLEPKEFDWKEKLNGRHDIGFIAQEVQEVVPELVKEVEGLNGEESHLSVDFTKVVPILVNAIKELKEEINELKSK